MKVCAETAGRVLNRLDKACRTLVITGCFDEIFFHGKPVLVGVEPHSMAWVNDRPWAEGEIAMAVKDLDAMEWGKLRRALADRRSLTFLDRMQRQLAAAEPRTELREASVLATPRLN